MVASDSGGTGQLGEVVTVALAAAGKIIQKNLTAADNDAIIGEYIAKLDGDKIGDVSC